MTHTVLVVEDEEELREMLRDALELNGYTVVTAEHGEDALAKLSAIEHLCLVILDLLMPGHERLGFLWRGCAQQSELASVPVVVHSSAAGQAPAGVTRVLQKPMMFDQLLSVVREYCAR